MLGYFDSYPPKSMNVSVESRDVPDGTGNVMRKKVLVVNKDFEVGDVIYKARHWFVLLHKSMLILFRRIPLSLPLTSTSKPRELTAPTVSATLRPNVLYHHQTASVPSSAQKNAKLNQNLQNLFSLLWNLRSLFKWLLICQESLEKNVMLPRLLSWITSRRAAKQLLFSLRGL